MSKIKIIIYCAFVGILMYLGATYALDYLRLPPGCRNKNAFGGCLAKNTIERFDIEGSIPTCLTIRPHICNIAQLEIENLCKPEVKIEINSIAITEKYTYLSFSLNEEGEAIIQKGADYTPPKQNEDIIINGSVDAVPFRVGYVVTKALCE